MESKTQMIQNNITILFFGSLRDLFKKDELSLHVPSEFTIRKLREKVFDAVEKKEERWKSLLYAVNHDFASLDTKLKDGDEVAFLPFVSGG